MSREKARAALEKLPALEAKIREQRREIENLRASLLHEGYRERSDYYHRGGPYPAGGECTRCHGAFRPGEHYVQYVDDDGQVVAAYHSQCAGTR